MMSHAAMVDEMPMQMNMTGGMVLTSKWQGIPIVFAGWLPTPAGITVSGSGAHIGSCIAIITVGIVYRLLAAWRARCERTWRRAALREFQERLPLEKQGVAASVLKEMPHPRFKLQGTDTC
ncbi:hypothetical protein BCR37DRAFT_154008 [Protomyces lactucae-debilis]|uniref:Copper transport protein n=1 Tax=Protomyces lactucae-debilis TaxID=2754530 RepID=A0A1Y2F353_PROLT|nr:uncharacterized protein BCR37DRAFT_154008 [Protomyces lactucae-debilis]ORY77395.1 hypothetical protein BCR37DRAFT_154008 [Protomyces lactucae-debilis]